MKFKEIVDFYIGFLKSDYTLSLKLAYKNNRL